jgi:integrase
MAKVKGYTLLPDGSLKGHVKVVTSRGVVQRTKRFAPGTYPSKIELWRASVKDEVLTTVPAKGTLGGDIERFLTGLPDGRPKDDISNWLNKWGKTDLAKEARARITHEQVALQLEEWKAKYSGSSLNHLKQALLTLWRELDRFTPLAARLTCPAEGIPRFKESAPRKGFFEQHEFAAVLKHLGPDYGDVVSFAAFSGWRKTEIHNLTWDEVDLPGGVIRLSPERSKNAEGRTLPITGPLVAVMERRVAEKAKHGLPWVFTYPYGGKRTKLVYRKVGDWRKSWKAALKAAGCEGKNLHDWRRTVVRNLTRSGVPQSIAMRWTGHKTDAVFKRYDIVTESDLHEAGEKLSAFLGSQGSRPE